ncbi:hypothetical protein [Glycomyces tritici]|uniref:Uncharacterized protein n=1 Tax=Glycomyces tritici TaxID=2665176 RepID=A0ABT7YQW0_9ACTN|nr:hypothetical protein [Glycomyces tritici]MDN3240784.1 hypothetical protein [Glycomyces tritici]
MTYPPQDPAGQPGGQYGPSQPGAQPPAGGYAPGQVGGDAYATSQYSAQPQYPGQPDPHAQYPQYDPAAGQQLPYQQYGAPPVQPNTKSGASTAFLVIGVVLLMALGALGGYFLLGNDDDEGSITAGDDSATADNTPGGGDGEIESESEGEGEGGEEPEAPAGPSGTHLEVPALGSVTPIPGEGWGPYFGPGEAYGLLDDAEGYFLPHGNEWISFFGVGVYNGAVAPYDATDLNASAAAAAETWLADGFDTVTGYQMSEIVYTEVEVDGRPGVLAEWRNSWTESPDTEDLFEDTAIVVVDVDGVNGFIGLASVSESAESLYGPAVEALLATDFDADTA